MILINTEEKNKIDFWSIKTNYEDYEKEVYKKYKKGYKDLILFATDMENLQFYFYEYIKRAKLINYDYTDILEKQKFYLKEFIKYFAEEKKKNNKDLIKKIKYIQTHMEYIGKYVYI